MREISERVFYRAELGRCSVPIGLRSVGEALFRPRNATPLRRISFTQILWSVRGEGRVRTGAKERAVKPGWVVFCLPESPHQVRSGAGDWEHRWITFDGPRAADIVSAFKIPGKPFQADICGGVFERLKRLLDDSSLDGERAAGVELYSFLSFLSAKAAGSVPGGGDSLETLLSKIQERIGDPDLSVKTLSDETGLSRFTIHRIFQEEMGVSPKRHIDAMRLRKAMSLLRERGASVEEAALAAGFANANYFSKFFRKKTSVTPAAFRAAGVMP